VGAGGFRAADHRTEIARIFNAVKNQDKRRFSPLACTPEDRFRFGITFCRHECDDSLVLAALNQSIQFDTRLYVDGNAGFTRQRGETGKPPILVCQQNAQQGSLAGAERFPDSLKAV
jgi:hypothetical protein